MARGKNDPGTMGARLLRPDAAPGGTAPGSTAGLWLAAALFALIFVLRLLFPDSDHSVALLYAVPVVIVAIERGPAAGVAAALLAVALGVVWDVLIGQDVDHSAGEYLIRAAIVIGLGASVGLLAKRLRESVDSQTRFWELSTDLLVTADSAGYLTRVSPSWTRELGWTAEELTSRPFIEFVHPEDREATETEFRGIIARGSGTDFENRYRRGDGQYRTLQWRARFEPATGMIFATARDMTERVEIRRRLHEAVDEANRANEAKSEFLSRMSHELRTPLNAILGFTQLLELSELDEADREAVTHIRDGGNHLLGLVSELLELSVIETGHIKINLEPVAAAEAMAEAAALIEPLAGEANVELSVGRCDPGIEVLADRQRLSQVLINLVSNAVKYNRPGGRVTVECERMGRLRARFAVVDDGTGMNDSELTRAFSPFERLGGEGSNVEGTGLGLPLSKRLVELMGGAIEARSTPGRGTTMSVSLSLADQGSGATPPKLRAPVGPVEVAAVLPDLDVVCIEDDEASAELLARGLGEAGAVRFTLARDGRSGLELIRDRMPDLVLLDLGLPGLGGGEVLALLQEDSATAGIPVIVISAAMSAGNEDRLIALGADAFLPKPVDIARLVELAAQLCLAGAGRGPRPL